jgi:hypothetical protein
MTKTPSEKQQKLKKLRNQYRSLKNKPEKLRTLLGPNLAKAEILAN